MEPKEDNVEAIAEDLTETIQPVTSAPESEQAITATTTSVDDTLKVSYDLLNKVKQLWEEYFGEGKKANLTLAIIIIATIPLLIATSTLVDFLNKLPVLPSVFELVGFGYSIWFIYRYLLLADTRKELIDGITTWKNKVFG
ncbi:CAAD domain-containing protein [Pseudanabaena sp. BC1403]|uniref:CAAD domain-containing protein n=1 Tax=Pseudanabaena sp. BC1403 TaxID=2043171 RepID=UPI000CD98BA7|nr:CAAD domain-containing protein [Pseudanabaena sp. BC1403]